MTNAALNLNTPINADISADELADINAYLATLSAAQRVKWAPEQFTPKP